MIKPVLLLSFTPNYNESICSFSYYILTILKDNRSSLFIYEIPDVETRSTATTTTANIKESYGKFIDYGEYCEEKKKNIISDGNEYYEE